MAVLARQSARVMYQPLGVAGILAAWNYPLFLSLAPVFYSDRYALPLAPFYLMIVAAGIATPRLVPRALPALRRSKS